MFAVSSSELIDVITPCTVLGGSGVLSIDQLTVSPTDI
tara:strand:+ start:631 stop:744 length:114 start_codon:yes stop_codon:yes gene_type:complete